jgi:predicted alpha/beta-fold hydrolase
VSGAATIRRYDEACAAPWWADGAHAQTVFGHLLPSHAEPMAGRRGVAAREIALDDGDRLSVYEIPGSSGVRVHLFHGLSGDVDSDYMRRATSVLAARGHSVWTVNHRGCGSGRGLAARPYHSGSSADMQAVLAASRASTPDQICLVIAFSLSGNIALLHAAEQRAPQADGVIAVNPPIDLARGADTLHVGFNRVYERRFVHRLRRAIRERERDGLLTDRPRIDPGVSLREFDELYTAPQAGFASAAEYYRLCSSLARLRDITTPTIVLTSADDPVVDCAMFRDLDLGAAVTLHVEPRGGPVGYLTRSGLSYRRWLDAALAHYVDELVRIARARA